jgi:hypothetical protein
MADLSDVLHENAIVDPTSTDCVRLKCEFGVGKEVAKR